MKRDSKRLRTVLEFLKGQSTVALSTCGTDGAPWAAPLFYVADDGLRLYWFSSASSRHSRDSERDPVAAAAVYERTEQWKEIRGVQMRGAVSVVAERARRASIAALYKERFHLGALFDAAIARSRLYCFEPHWIRYVDNSRRFGYKFELDLRG